MAIILAGKHSYPKCLSSWKSTTKFHYRLTLWYSICMSPESSASSAYPNEDLYLQCILIIGPCTVFSSGMHQPHFNLISACIHLSIGIPYYPAYNTHPIDNTHPLPKSLSHM